MRLFIAFDVPSEELIKIQKEFNLEGVKLVKEFHCTLKFLGEVEDNNINLIKEKLSKIKFKIFNANFGKLGVFPNENYIRVIYLGLESNGRIEELRDKIEDALKDEFEKEERFKAHVTLARVKFIRDKKPIIKRLKIKTPKMEFKIKEFNLMKSELTKGGAVYNVVENYRLE